MDAGERPRPLDELEALIERGDREAIERFLAARPLGEAVRWISRLDDDERARAVALLAPEGAAELVDRLPESQAVDVIDRLEPRAAAAIIQELRSDERADLLAEVVPPQAEEILSAMRPEEAAETRELGRYDRETAGGLMVKEYLRYPARWTVARVVEDLRRHADRYRDYVVQYAFVVDGGKRLLGVLRLRDLLLAPAETPLDRLMSPDAASLPDAAALDEVREFFESHGYYGVPVTDGAGRLVGVIRRADVEEALADRVEGDYLKSLGIVGGEELRSMPLLLRSRRRLSWLSVNIVLNVLAASVIAFYQETLSAVIALAVFLPIISDMSGCSGNQAVAVSMRELTLGLVRPSEVLRVWLKELSVGLVSGIVLGGLIALVAWAWKGDPVLGGVVGTAMAINTLVAVSLGGMIPLVLRRMKLDPALASGPILTTVTDMCGFFLVLSLAAAALPWLR